MQLRHIEAFHAMMLCGTVSGAAKLLNLTQPAVSQYLKSLELQLGYPLFERVRGRLLPTNEAQILHSEVSRLHSQLDTVRDVARNLRKHEGKPLRIMAAPALALEIVPRAMRGLLNAHPDISVSIRTAYSKQVLTSIVRGEIDVGVVYRTMENPIIEQHTIGRGKLVCAVPPTSFQGRSRIAVEDLRGVTVFVPEYHHPLGKMLLELYREHGLIVAEHVQIQQLHVALNMVMAGLGIAIVDSFTVMSCNPRKVRILALEPLIDFDICAAYTNTAAKPKMIDLFIDSLCQATGPSGGP